MMFSIQFRIITWFLCMIQCVLSEQSHNIQSTAGNFYNILSHLHHLKVIIYVLAIEKVWHAKYFDFIMQTYPEVIGITNNCLSLVQIFKLLLIVMFLTFSGLRKVIEVVIWPQYRHNLMSINFSCYDESLKA